MACICRDGWTNAGCREHGVDAADEGLTDGERQRIADDLEHDVP